MRRASPLSCPGHTQLWHLGQHCIGCQIVFRHHTECCFLVLLCCCTWNNPVLLLVRHQRWLLHALQPLHQPASLLRTSATRLTPPELRLLLLTGNPAPEPNRPLRFSVCSGASWPQVTPLLFTCFSCPRSALILTDRWIDHLITFKPSHSCLYAKH